MGLDTHNHREVSGPKLCVDISCGHQILEQAQPLVLGLSQSVPAQDHWAEQGEFRLCGPISLSWEYRERVESGPWGHS